MLIFTLCEIEGVICKDKVLKSYTQVNFYNRKSLIIQAWWFWGGRVGKKKGKERGGLIIQGWFWGGRVIKTGGRGFDYSRVVLGWEGRKRG